MQTRSLPARAAGPGGWPAYIAEPPASVRAGLFTDRAVLAAEAWDQAGGISVRKSADASEESGRGLDMVHELTGARRGWHHAATGPGKCVQAEFPIPQAEPSAGEPAEEGHRQ